MLQHSTVKFLKELKKNNNKPWFDTNRKKYEDAKADYTVFVEQLIATVAKFDDSIKDIKAKDCIFRINRDIRFSKDKTPYKTNMACYFNKAGKKGNGAGYYLHIEPGGSFAAGGIWMPAAPDLAKIRQEIDYGLDEWKKLTGKTTFKKQFPKGLSENEVLTRPPKGYDENNPAIDFIKMKSFVISKPFSDAEVQGGSFVKEVAKTFQYINPLVNFLNKAID